MTKVKNNIDFISNVEILYSPNELINKSILNRYVLDGASYKIKTITTCDGKNVIVNDTILDYLNTNNIKLKSLTYEKLISYNFYKATDYILVMDLLKEAKGSVTTYIEIVDESKKYSKEKELISAISTFGVRAVISSSKEKVIKYFKKKAPFIARGYKFESYDNDDLKLSNREKKKILNVKIPMGVKPDFVEYDINCLPNKKLDNIKVVSYLIDTDSKLNKASVYSHAFIVKNNYSDREL